MKTTETKASNPSPRSGYQSFFNKMGPEAFFSAKQETIQTKPFFYKSPNQSSIKPKLSIGQPGDKYEQEADAMADQVVQRLKQPEAQQTKSSEKYTPVTPAIQPKCAACEEEEKLQKKEEWRREEEQLQLKPIFESNAPPPDEEIQLKCAACEQEDKLQKKEENGAVPTASTSIESSLAASRGSGSPLPKTTRRQMEGAFGTDFSSVHIHTGSKAVQLSQELGAQAFTHGSDVYFNSGKYNTESREGQHLLAHELTHTIQQRKGIQQHTIQKQQGPETEAPQLTAPPVDINDVLPTECGDIEQSGLNRIKAFLTTVHREVNGWRSWRNQENWDDPNVSGRIPSISDLLTGFSTFSATNLGCTGSLIFDIPVTHTAVRRLFRNGVGSTAGVTEEEIHLMLEWMRYEKNIHNPLQAYLQVSPGAVVEHHYTLNVIAAAGQTNDVLGVGLGAGGALETPIGKAKAGCYLKLGAGGGYVVFRYHNNMGMRWSQGYLQGNVGLSGECAFDFSIGPSISTSFGSEQLCSGSAEPDPTEIWYGPKDFAGGTVEQSAGIGGGVGVSPGVAGSYLKLIVIGKDNIFFNTSGACIDLLLGINVGVRANILQLGGQGAVGGFEGQLGELQTLEICDNAMLDQITELLVSRILYFDTGSDNPQVGAHAIDNNEALSTAIRAITDDLDNSLVTSIQIRITGHASPMYRGASTAAVADLENQALAMRRAENTSVLLYDGLNYYPAGLPPMSIMIHGFSTPAGVENQVGSSTESQGSAEGLQETGDRSNNYQRYRRANVEVYVKRLVDNNISLIIDLVNPENNVCQ